jgi:hypothetical protein
MMGNGLGDQPRCFAVRQMTDILQQQAAIKLSIPKASARSIAS